MSNIVVILKEKAIDVSVLKQLHKLLGGSLATIRTAISKGLPVVEMEIFDNQYQEKASLLRGLISLIRSSGFGVEIYELPEGDSFATSNVRDESLINEDVLENILDSSDEEIDRQSDV